MKLSTFAERAGYKMQTMSGLQYWGDCALYSGWRIQKHVRTGECRLLNRSLLSVCRGTLESCKAAVAELAAHGIRQRGTHAVLLVHGLGRSGGSFDKMQRAFLSQGYESAAIDYCSLRRSIPEHAEQLVELLDNLEGIDTVSFVTHSMGGIIVRQAMSREAEWKSRIRIGRVCMIGPPNNGSAIAEFLSRYAAFKAIVGDSGLALATSSIGSVPLPEFEFGVIAGGTGGKGFNPLLEGDDDGVVTVKETRLAGMKDFLLVNRLHPTIHRQDEVIAASVAFIRDGAFPPSIGLPFMEAGNAA